MITPLQKLFASSNSSLLETFKPLYVVLTIGGLFPYNVKFKTKHSCVIIHRSIYWNSLRAVSILLTMLVLAGFFVQNMILDLSVKDEAFMSRLNYIVEVVILLVTCIIAYISIYLYRHKLVKALNTLASAWTDLPTTKNDILANVRFHVRLTLFYLFFVLMLQIAVNYTRDDGPWKMFYVTVSFIYPQMIQFTALAFYYVLVLLVVALLRKINAVLETVKNKRTVVGSYRNMEAKLLVFDLTAIESVFVKAFEVKRDINEAFQATILLTAIQCFHAIVSEAHIIYHSLLVSRTLTTHETINFSIWIGYQLIKMYGLATSGNLLKITTIQIGQTLHSIPVEKHDIRSLIETQHFTSLMKYQSSELTVYGYFPLNASLMFKVVASTTMYLIILVQFDKKS